VREGLVRKYLTTLSGADVRRNYATGAWERTTLLDVAMRRMAQAPTAGAVTDSRVSLDNTELVRAVLNAAGLLRGLGVTAGDPVVIQLRNSALYPIVQIAVNALGAVFVPVKTSTSPSENAAVVDRVGAKALVIAAEFRADTARSTVGGRGVVVTDTEIWDAVEHGEPSRGPEASAADADEPMCIMFSSGTTGIPKGIINTTNSQLSAVRRMIDEMRLDDGDAWLIVPPMAHNAGWLYSFVPAYLSGARAIFLERFDPRRALALLAEHDIRNVFLTPTHANDVLDVLDGGAQAPPNLRRVFIGGAATAPQMKAALRNRLGVEVVGIYGSTENQAVSYTRPGCDASHSDHTVGWPCPNSTVAIFDVDRSTILAPNATGEIGTRGPGTFVGYFADQAATDAAFNEDGWFLTGDLGHLDDPGALHITGRRKELIIRGGLNIAPEDVERPLALHPVVERVAAVGVPDERLGEIVCAVLVSRDELDLPAVTGFLRTNGVGTHLWPEALLRVDEFPLTDIGKVQRGRLRDIAVDALNRGTLQTLKRGVAPGTPHPAPSEPKPGGHTSSA
jgi:acyl-CoA synthetase (AMP-forming)/AMP-acid ligase II